MPCLILASGSEIRASLLRQAGVSFEVRPARIDEEMLRAGLEAEGVSPRDVADVLAEHKAMRVSKRAPVRLVLGCDQVLDLDGQVLGKPADLDAARERLKVLRGRKHLLHGAAVLYQDGQPIWRHVSEARLTMRNFSDEYLERYLRLEEQIVCETVGGYAVERLGVSLFSRVEGDYFGILGLPLLELLEVLVRRGDIEG